MAKAIDGKVLLATENFPADLSRICGGVTGDVIIERAGEKGYYTAHATFKKIKMSKASRSKCKVALERLTGVAWMFDENGLFQAKAFSRKDLEDVVKGNPQKELLLNMKKTPLGKACDKMLDLIAKKKKAIADIQSHKAEVIRCMEKEGRHEVIVDCVTFKIKIDPEKKTLEIKGN